MLAAVSLAAQNPADGKFTASFGYHADNWTTDSSDDTAQLDGIFLGVNYEIPVFNGAWGVSTGLYYTLGYDSEKTDVVESGVTVHVKESDYAHGLALPIRMTKGWELAPGKRLFIYAGPMLTYGLSFTGKLDLSHSSSSINTDVDYYSGVFKRFDIKLGGGVGLDISEQYRILLGVDMGLLNLSDISGVSFKSNRVSIGVGYHF